MSKKTLGTKQQIIENILQWQTDAAAAQLERERASLSAGDRAEVENLLERYREWDQLVTGVLGQAGSRPASTKELIAVIPPDILKTHPAYRELSGSISEGNDAAKLSKALEKCERARVYIEQELDIPKAEEALESARELYPRWESSPELRDRLDALTDEAQRLSEGLRIQQEISALRETGGQAAYQRSLELLNEYDALGLDAYHLNLLDINEEREALLKMIVRADGSSWTYRMLPSSSQEIIRLEQSIRSLEDAENKNLRVLINNNSRLLSILIRELENMDADSEEAIQTTERINELREKNQLFERDILNEVGTRSDEYCEMAEQALLKGELKAAQTNLKLARDAGKPAMAGDEDALGEVTLPASVLDRIARLETRVNDAQVIRTRVTGDMVSVRRQFYSDEDVTLNKLFSWKKSLEKCMEEDATVPGLDQLLREVSERYEASRTYITEKTIYDIDSDLAAGDIAAAKRRLDTLTSYFGSGEQNEFLSEQLKKVNAAEVFKRKVDTILEELERVHTTAVNDTACSKSDLKNAEELSKKIDASYKEAEVSEPESVRGRRTEILRSLRSLADASEPISLVRKAAASGEFTPESESAADALESGSVYAFPSIRELLTLYRLKEAAGPDLSDEQIESFYSHAAKHAEDSGNAELQERVGNELGRFHERSEQGQRYNALLDSLKQFYNEHKYAAGMDFVRSNVPQDLAADRQMRLWIEKIEQGYRIERAEAYLSEAKISVAGGDYDKAEEDLAQSLDFFYTIEGAQLQKTIAVKREEEEKDTRDLRELLSFPLENLENPDEKTAGQLRVIREKMQTIDKERVHDLNLLSELSTLESRVDQVMVKEANAFEQMKNNVESALLSGEDGLIPSAAELQRMESRTWVGNYRAEINRLKTRRNDIERVYVSLKTVIAQSESYAVLGDFRSANRILSSYTQENLSAYPAWLEIIKEEEEERLKALNERYLQVRARFDPDGEKAGGYIGQIQKIFEQSSPDAEKIFALQTELQRERMILKNEIGIESEENVYVSSISYLEEVLKWAESIAEFRFGVVFPQELIPMEPLYQMRRTGKKLYETIPPLLIEIQPILARENKWLERRTRVRQAFGTINDLYAGPDSIAPANFKAVNEELDNISLIVLTDDEEACIDKTKKIMARSDRTRRLIVAVIILLAIVLAALYYFLPWLVKQP